MSERAYLTTAEVADLFRTAESTVRYWRHIGYGPRGIKVGRRVLYPQAEIKRFQDQLGDSLKYLGDDWDE